jgi:hypothetical protein
MRQAQFLLRFAVLLADFYCAKLSPRAAKFSEDRVSAEWNFFWNLLIEVPKKTLVFWKK